jgi:class 3 adenylate cyclase
VTPETHFARSGDGHIAYQVVGEGPIDVVFVPEWLNHIEAQWDEPRSAAFLRRLASIGRLILFNKRGMGLSDPVPLDRPPTIEQWVEDLRATLDAAGSEHVAVFGAGAGGATSILFAAEHPDRVTALALLNCAARVAAAPDYPFGLPPPALDGMRKTMLTMLGTGAMLRVIAPDVADDERLREWYGHYERLSVSPGLALATQTMLFQLDVRGVLPAIRVPALVLHRRGNPFIVVEHGRFLAERIPGATYLELSGAEHAYWAGNTGEVLDEVEAFFTGTRKRVSSDRVLATVLFTDIVGSTERAGELGDRAWRELLDRHHAVVRAQIQRFRGREIDTAGDGFFVTFDGPARAIRCALAITRELRAAGIEIRAGIHTGELEIQGDSFAGIGVHIGARIGALASGGQVLVSRTVVDLVAGSGITFEDAGTHALKGVSGEWQVFAIARDAAAELSPSG